MKHRCLAILAATLLGMGMVAAPANAVAGGKPTGMHCADHQTELKVEVPGDWDFSVDGPYVEVVSVYDTTTEAYIDVTVTIDGTGVSFSSDEYTLESVDFCIKGGTDSTGLISGLSGTTEGIPNRGGNAPNISYVVLYSVTTVSNIVPCGEGLSVNGGFEIFEATVQMGQTSGQFQFDYEALNQPDWFEIYYDGVRIYDIVSGTQANNPIYAPLFQPGGRFDGASGTDPSYSNSTMVTFGDATSTSTEITLRVTGSEPGTLWSAKVNCPVN